MMKNEFIMLPSVREGFSFQCEPSGKKPRVAVFGITLECSVKNPLGGCGIFIFKQESRIAVIKCGIARVRPFPGSLILALRSKYMASRF